MRERIRRFMIGRYGLDDLGRFLNVLTLVILLVSMLFLPALSIFGILLLVYEYFRIFSRNHYKRAMENGVYLRARMAVKNRVLSIRQRLAQRKIYRFYRCPNCRQALRVPRGKGKLQVSCPKCGTRFMKKS